MACSVLPTAAANARQFKSLPITRGLIGGGQYPSFVSFLKNILYWNTLSGGQFIRFVLWEESLVPPLQSLVPVLSFPKFAAFL